MESAITTGTDAMIFICREGTKVMIDNNQEINKIQGQQWWEVGLAAIVLSHWHGP